jgi:hypothetical protein
MQGPRRRALLALGFAAVVATPRAIAQPVPASAPNAFLLDAPNLRVLAPADLVARPPRFPFPVGERLEYAVSWFGVPAGAATIEVARFIEVDGARYAHVVAIVRSNPVFSAIYEVNDRSEAWIDLDRFATVRTRAVEKHASKRYDESVRYDGATHFVIGQLDKLHKQQRRELVFDFGPFAYDTSDLVYLLRALPLASGYAVGVPTYANRKLFEFRIEVAAPRTIETAALGAMPALAVHPSTRLDGRDYAVGEGVVWVSGPTRVPVRLDGWIRTAQSSFLVQGLRAVLVRYVPSAPGWTPAQDPRVDPVTQIPQTHDGIPDWEPPPAVRAAREAAGLSPHYTDVSLPATAR